MGKTLDLGRLANILSLDGSGNITVTTNLIMSSITQDNALTQVIVRDGTSGQFKYRDVSTILGSSLYTANGSLTSNRTLTGAGYSLTFTGLGAGTAFTDVAFQVNNNDATKGFYMTGDGRLMPVALTQTLGRIGYYYWQYAHFDGGMTIGNNDQVTMTGVGTTAGIDWNIYNLSATGNIDFRMTTSQTRAMSVRSDGEVWIAPAAWSDKGDYKLQVDGGAYIGGSSIINLTGYQNWTNPLYIKNTDGGGNEYGFAFTFYSDAGGPNRVINIGPTGNYTSFSPQGTWTFASEVGLNSGATNQFHSDWIFTKKTSNTAGTRWLFIDSTTAATPAGTLMSWWSDSKNVNIGPYAADTGFKLNVEGTLQATIPYFSGITEDATKTRVMVQNAADGRVYWRNVTSIIPAITATVDEGKILTVVSDVATWQDPTEVEVATYGTF